MACKTLKSVDTVAFAGFFFGIVSFLVTFNLEQMPWLPYPLLGNLQDVDKSSLPDHWEQGTVLIVLLWGISYLRKSVFVILKQKYILNQKSDLIPVRNGVPNRNRRTKHTQAHRINDNNVDISVISESYKSSFGGRENSKRQNINSLKYNQKFDQEPACNYALPTVLYHTVFGMWIGWACNTHENVQYRSSDNEYVATGVLLWLASEAAIVIRTIVLYRKKDLFNRRAFIWKEICEVTSTSGFAVFTLTLPSISLALMRFILATFSIYDIINGHLF